MHTVAKVLALFALQGAIRVVCQQQTPPNRPIKVQGTSYSYAVGSCLSLPRNVDNCVSYTTMSTGDYQELVYGTESCPYCFKLNNPVPGFSYTIKVGAYDFDNGSCETLSAANPIDCPICHKFDGCCLLFQDSACELSDARKQPPPKWNVVFFSVIGVALIALAFKLKQSWSLQNKEGKGKKERNEGRDK